MNVIGVILAAGKSKRMGTNKLLLKVGDTTLIESILAAVEKSGVTPIVVLSPENHQEVLAALKHRHNQPRIVINENYIGGMASSFKRGLAQALNVDAAFLFLGDQPILDYRFLASMVDTMEQMGAWIISPVCNGKRGHPLLFKNVLFGEIQDLPPDRTIRDVVHQNQAHIVTVEAPAWTTMDIDTQEDYETMQRYLNAGPFSF